MAKEKNAFVMEEDGHRDAIFRDLECERVAQLRDVAGRSGLSDASSLPDPIMTSCAMRELAAMLERLAAAHVNLVISGQSGSGKEVIARYLHKISSQAREPFVRIACGGLSADTVKALFHEFRTTADETRPQAQRRNVEAIICGTLYLDQIDETPDAIQAQLATVIDEARNGIATESGRLRFEGRLVAATELPIGALRQKLRPGLYHRLAVVTVNVPALQEREADIDPLVCALVQELAAELGVAVPQIEPDVIPVLCAGNWPGNVRQLRNVLLRAMTSTAIDTLSAKDLFPAAVASGRPLARAAFATPTLPEVRGDAERQRILAALAAHDGKISPAARSLGISRVTIWRKMKNLGLLCDREQIMMATDLGREAAPSH